MNRTLHKLSNIEGEKEKTQRKIECMCVSKIERLLYNTYDWNISEGKNRKIVKGN